VPKAVPVPVQHPVPVPVPQPYPVHIRVRASLCLSTTPPSCASGERENVEGGGSETLHFKGYK
jgi:hypothetical protein